MMIQGGDFVPVIGVEVAVIASLLGCHVGPCLRKYLELLLEVCGILESLLLHRLLELIGEASPLTLVLGLGMRVRTGEASPPTLHIPCRRPGFSSIHSAKRNRQNTDESRQGLSNVSILGFEV